MVSPSEHRQARDNKATVSLHEFKMRYKKQAQVIYGFVEGKDDPCFYRGFIENSLPDGWNTELWPAGNKDQVFKIYAQLDWTRFHPTQVLFFVDRDLSDFINESIK